MLKGLIQSGNIREGKGGEMKGDHNIRRF